MMRQRLGTSFFAGGDVKVLNLTLGAADMLLVLPNRIDGLPHVEQSLTLERLNDWRKQFQTKFYEVDVELPRFEVDWSRGLDKDLCELGMLLPFADNADFSGISSATSLKISAVQHKSHIKLQEEGTEAAAATAVLVAQPRSTGGPPPTVRASFEAKHPFLFLIQERRTGSVVFMGRVVDPRSK
jgi:serpin B